MKTTTINGTVYTFKKFDQVRNWKSDIFELYEKPSQDKIEAFNEREKKLTCIYWLIGGKQNYSIFGDVIDENGDRHPVKITKSNRFILY